VRAARRLLVPALAALLACAGPARAEEGPAPEDDPFADFDEEWQDPWTTEDRRLRWTGFVEGALGARDSDVAGLDRLTLGELRVRAETRYDHEDFQVEFKGDLAWDEVTDELEPKLRELAVAFRPLESVDAKLGRQVLTWGTGDLLFLNDLFPKDFISFFAGRDEDYLKLPSDAARFSVFTDVVNVDVAWMPRFRPDNYLYGERFAFWNPAVGEVIAPQPPRRADEPSTGEVAIRLFRTIEAVEYAAYGYAGRWKQPLGVDAEGLPRFPRLRSFGASVRRPFYRGLLNAEFSWYDSRDDRDGDDPATPNSELRLLLGYEQELVRNLNAGTQFYAERIQHHDRLLANSPDPEHERERWRTVVTLRVTHRAMQEKLTTSVFVFASPTESDYYLRPSVAWRRDDQWLFAGGLNLFGGSEDHTFFGQLEDNSNAWVRVRYHY
jgi:hypothetical protein